MKIKSINKVNFAAWSDTIARFEYPANPNTPAQKRQNIPSQENCKVLIEVGDDFSFLAGGFQATVTYYQVQEFVSNQEEVDSGADPVYGENNVPIIKERAAFSIDEAQAIYEVLGASIPSAADGGNLVTGIRDIVLSATKFRVTTAKQFFGLTSPTDYEDV